jgi:hypothetical protein
MITDQKIKIYKKHGGDVDFWGRVGSAWEKSIMNDDDWGIISGFLQDLYLSNNKLTSAEFDRNLYEKLEKVCDNQSTIDGLRKLALTNNIT